MFLSQNIHRSAKSQEETNVTQGTGHLLYTGNREQVMVTYFICVSMAWLNINFSAKYSNPFSKINFKTCHSLLQNKYKLIELLTYFLLCYMHMHPLELEWKSLVLKVWTRVKKNPEKDWNPTHIVCLEWVCLIWNKKFHFYSWKPNRENNLEEIFSWRGNVAEWYLLSWKRKNLQQLDGLSGVCCTLV